MDNHDFLITVNVLKFRTFTQLFLKILSEMTNRVDPDQTGAVCIATDKALFFIRKRLISFLFLDENICCGYSLEAPRRGASNEYPQHMFSSRNKKKYYVDTPSYL